MNPWIFHKISVGKHTRIVCRLDCLQLCGLVETLAPLYLKNLSRSSLVSSKVGRQQLRDEDEMSAFP